MHKVADMLYEPKMVGRNASQLKLWQSKVTKMKEYQRMRDSGEFEEMPKRGTNAIKRAREVGAKPKWHKHAQRATSGRLCP